MRYESFCLADPVFYDTPDRWEVAGERFTQADRPLPDGWHRHEHEGWMLFHSDGHLPEQGWKVHVSACPGNAERVIATTVNFCLVHDVAVKFLRSRNLFTLRNSKYADRGSSGKLLTLYPRDDAELHFVLRDLGTALAGEPGPYILSDLRWQDGPLYVRYGGFRSMRCLSPTGELVPAIRDPEGTLVPDRREPTFTPPPWVSLPPFLTQPQDEAPPTDFPYRIEKALHFSNGGGVYLARDTGTGERVVLKEARPFAGLDYFGDDAVSRLGRERDILTRLAGLDVVPRLIEYRTLWEHHFLVQEYMEGETLNSLFVKRHPLIQPTTTEDDIAEYTRWTVGVLGRIEDGLASIHGRGVVFADLAPRNVIVRPSGDIVFVDYELSYPMSEPRRRGLGTPGFAAPPGVTGEKVDEFALQRMRLFLFHPVTPILDQYPEKEAMYARAAAQLFPLPEAFIERTSSGRAESTGGAVSAAMDFILHGDEHVPDWDVVSDSVANAILASATPERTDRLFPGDPAQFESGGLGFGFGAAGVLYALSVSGCGRFPEHEKWLLRAVQNNKQIRAGFWDGLHGVAYVLDHLGYRDEALLMLDRASLLPEKTYGIDLMSGMAGIGLNLLHFAARTGEHGLRESALNIIDRMITRMTDIELGRTEERYVSTPEFSAGLFHGFSGPALLFIRAYEDTGETWLLDAAESALRRDLKYCVTIDDSMHVDEGWRLMPYLDGGSLGIGLVLAKFLAHRENDAFRAALAATIRTAEPQCVINAGLLHGRASMIAFRAYVERPRDSSDWSPPLVRYMKGLAWHAVPFRGNIAFPGASLRRLSMDVSTGSAGILLTVGAACGKRAATLPFLSPGERDSAYYRKGGETDELCPRVANAGDFE